jgi:2-polyprenyl-6-methoxyphenol hydroxylase-like FAD-dependent oxidoreductase
MGAELQSDVLIVGAGIAGLMAANALRQMGYHVIVVWPSIATSRLLKSWATPPASTPRLSVF